MRVPTVKTDLRRPVRDGTGSVAGVGEVDGHEAREGAEDHEFLQDRQDAALGGLGRREAVGGRIDELQVARGKPIRESPLEAIVQEQASGVQFDHADHTLISTSRSSHCFHRPNLRPPGIAQLAGLEEVPDLELGVHRANRGFILVLRGLVQVGLVPRVEQRRVEGRLEQRTCLVAVPGTQGNVTSTPGTAATASRAMSVNRAWATHRLVRIVSAAAMSKAGVAVGATASSAEADRGSESNRQTSTRQALISGVLSGQPSVPSGKARVS